MNFQTREINAIGHWSSNSRMGERYDRSVCANELLLRNAIIRKMASGWIMAESFHLPETVPVSARIGKDKRVRPAAAIGPIAPPETQPIAANSLDSTSMEATPVANTQVPSTFAPTPVDEVIDDTLIGSLPL